MKKLYLISVIAVMVLFSMFSCTEENVFMPEEENQYTCKLSFDVSRGSYGDKESSRGAVNDSEMWEDGSVVYLSFAVGAANRVRGKAVYNKESDYWTLYYNGNIANGTTASCDAYFFEGNVTETNSIITIPQDAAVYSDKTASYVKTQDGMKVSAYLSPLTGRIRFKGAAGMNFHLSGVCRYDSFDLSTNELSGSDNIHDIKVGTDGWSSYVYPYFPEISRKLVLAYGNLSFSTECEHPILDAGLSGYMEIPTEDKHNGWDMTKMTLPAVASVTVSDIGVNKASFRSRVTDDGNGAISDCGFCYSTAANPTISDAHISYGKTTADFGKTVTGFSENTTYHVRAYAINELGVAYSEDVAFKTLEVTVATLSPVAISGIGGTYAELESSVTSVGNGTLIDAGFVLSTEFYPTVNDRKISCGAVSTLKTKVDQLTPETKYYVRAYATNEKGTAYSEELSFTTGKAFSTETFTVNGVDFTVVAVEGGTFTMGATSEQGSDAYDGEKPTHQVTLSDFYIGKYEVTQELWKAVMGSNPSYFTGTNLPVEYVSWVDCQSFITKLNELTGKTFRLPTEAEWEYAARGGKKSKGYKYSGSNTIDNVAWYTSISSSKTHEVGTKSPNELGIYDMSGNVWEWCSDWYGSYSSSSQTDPTGPTSGSARVLRGGSWGNYARYCRVSLRDSTAPSSRGSDCGFRLVLVP